MNKIQLKGCSPDSLMMNLKALGIFRILAEQKDSEIMAEWQRDVFVLHTSLEENELEDFFLNKYVPTPIVSPWNGGSGFFDIKDSVIDKIEQSNDERLKEYCDVFVDVRNILKEHIPQYSELSIKKDKESIKKLKDIIKDKKYLLLNQLRNKINGKLMPWFDAMYVMASEKPSYGSILGSGGNDGNFEISENFINCICQCILLDDKSVDNSRSWIKGSLFGDSVKLTDNSSAHFYPDGYKGPNCSSDGFKEYSLVNPWDYILMVEGTLLFAGNVSRRSISRKAAFPFTVESSMVGYGTSSIEKNRGELWIPLWDNPATYQEIKHVFNEGRSQIGTKYVETGCDFARALASLGIQRGISRFYRFGILERKGQAYLATNLGRINVRKNPHVNLFTDVDDWLSKIRQVKNLPQSIISLLNNMDDVIIKFCTNHKKQHLQEALIIIGKIEAINSKSSYMRANILPLKNLSFEWVDACYDKTPEFRLAVSLASIFNKNNQYSIRYNLEALKKPGKIEFASNSPHAVWNKRNTVQNMIAILERRCIDAQINNSEIPLESKIYAPLKDVLLFLEGMVDYEKIGNLLFSLSMINYNDYPEYHNSVELWSIPEHMPETYVSIKLNFMPPLSNKIKLNFLPPLSNKINMKFEPSIIPLLKSGNIGLAQKIAHRRLYMSGTHVHTYDNSRHVSRSTQEIPESMIDKIAAALLFPLNPSDMNKMIKRITKPKLQNDLIT